MQRNVKPSAILFQAFSSVIRSFTGSSRQCFEAPTFLSLLLILSFYRTNVEPIDQVKSNLSQIFPKAAGLPQTNHPKSAQNSEKSSYYQRVLTEELLRNFSFGHHSRQSIANSGNGKIMIARYHIRYFFQKRVSLPLTLLENHRVVHGTYLSVPFPSHPIGMHACPIPSHPMGRFSLDSHRNDIPRDKPRVVHGTYLSVPFPSHSKRFMPVPSHGAFPMGFP